MRAARHTRYITGAVLAAAVVVVGCGSDDDGGSSGDGIASLLSRMPAVERGDDLIQYTYGDLVTATELAGSSRPTSTSAADGTQIWPYCGLSTHWP